MRKGRLRIRPQRRPLFPLATTVLLATLIASGLLPGTAAAGTTPRGATATAAASVTAPEIDHVVVVILENEAASSVWAHAPYERYLARTYGNATAFYAACHPSAADYLPLFAGVSDVCGSDVWHNETNATLNTEFDAAGRTWGAYAESLPSVACARPANSTHGLFATRHVPALYFGDVIGNLSYCRSHVLDSHAFNDSVANGTTRNFSMYTPNLCDDGHTGCGGNRTDAQLTSQGDAWLRDWLAPMLNHTGRFSSTAEQQAIRHTAFVITWDEAVGSNAGFALRGVSSGQNYDWCAKNGARGDAVCGGHVFTAIVSAYSVNRTFVTPDAPYGICHTVEWLFHLPPLGNPGGLDGRPGFPAMKGLFNFTSNG